MQGDITDVHIHIMAATTMILLLNRNSTTMGMTASMSITISIKSISIIIFASISIISIIIRMMNTTPMMTAINIIMKSIPTIFLHIIFIVIPQSAHMPIIMPKEGRTVATLSLIIVKWVMNSSLPMNKFILMRYYLTPTSKKLTLRLDFITTSTSKQRTSTSSRTSSYQLEWSSQPASSISLLLRDTSGRIGS